MRAATNTPAGPTGALVARFPASGRLPRLSRGSGPHSWFRGLLSVHSRCGSYGRWVTQGDPFHRSVSNDIVTSIIRFDCYRLERRFAGRDLQPLRDGAFSRHTESGAETLRVFGLRSNAQHCHRRNFQSRQIKILKREGIQVQRATACVVAPVAKRRNSHVTSRTQTSLRSREGKNPSLRSRASRSVCGEFAAWTCRRRASQLPHPDMSITPKSRLLN